MGPEKEPQRQTGLAKRAIHQSRGGGRRRDFRRQALISTAPAVYPIAPNLACSLFSRFLSILLSSLRLRCMGSGAVTAWNVRLASLEVSPQKSKGSEPGGHDAKIFSILAAKPRDRQVYQRAGCGTVADWEDDCGRTALSGLTPDGRLGGAVLNLAAERCGAGRLQLGASGKAGHIGAQGYPLASWQARFRCKWGLTSPGLTAVMGLAVGLGLSGLATGGKRGGGLVSSRRSGHGRTPQKRRREGIGGHAPRQCAGESAGRRSRLQTGTTRSRDGVTRSGSPVMGPKSLPGSESHTGKTRRRLNHH